jgi:tRNA threonylcarbamoyladenosine modification (KEOPS) complex  Pcc1 subunit
MAPTPHQAQYAFRFPDPLDARAVYESLQVEAGDRIPNVEATLRFDATDPTVLHLDLGSPDLGDLRAATKSYLTRIRAAGAALGEASARQKGRE